MVRIPTHRAPIHPGEMLLEEFLVPMGITQRDLADASGVLITRGEPQVPATDDHGYMNAMPRLDEFSSCDHHIEGSLGTGAELAGRRLCKGSGHRGKIIHRRLLTGSSLPSAR